ncbi:hypothetical protein [Hyphomicrobium sp. ghe19]|uniref:hypothetical protein n=1 Tax=Hyphomicrobium sp. ghe19 TaxID=2682968 RepID=UPI0013672476|nr:hypothetical protein HYPP_02502 [Hyphomicrobium sp. ghe19]
MAKLKRNHFTGLSNIFGEKGKNLADLLNAKPDHGDFDSITAITTPDATDEATAIALANANKAKINAILAKLKTPA